ncbi:MMPL family protein [Bacillus sp. OV166]|uniref:MMPL family transporter n=1 Tax=Bacillus sp. OV166 TaxID=1882763 RepID=UPI000A2ADACB|nr:MMPL family transporter [Bacillus sp. OV166]SMQ66264.1 MMPL family protein [Bacillus sp. OV166]
MEKKWFKMYGNAVSGKKGRWIVLITWLLLVAVLNVTLPQADSQKNEMAQNLESHSPSQQAKKVAEKEFPATSGTPALLTWYKSAGITDEDLSLIQKYSKELDKNPVNSLDSVVPFYQFPLPVLKQQLSQDGTTLILQMHEERALKKRRTVAPQKSKAGFAARLGNLIVKKPLHLMVITLLFLGVFAFFSTKIIYTYDTLSSFPKDMPSREGFKIISEHFNPGDLAPVQVIVQTDGKANTVKEDLQKVSFVELVSKGIKGSKNSNIISYNIEMNVNPYSNKAMSHIPDLRNKVERSLKRAGITHASDKVWIGGLTAEQYDTEQTTNQDSRIIIPIVISIIAVLLLAYLRSLTATAYLIGTVLLSFFSVLGLGWVLLHYIFGVEAIQGFIPLYAFVFIVALGEDYNIFMISSIWKKSKQLPLPQAIKEGVAESGSVITSAGIILAGTFAILTTLPIQVLVHFGTITAIGVLLDTFIVRPLLVPSITVLLGKWAFWPSKQHIEAVERNTAHE